MRAARIVVALGCALLAAPPVGTAGPRVPAELQNNIHLRWGQPGGDCRILTQRYYVICEDTAHRVPLWVAYHLERSDLRQVVTRTSNPFHADRRLPRGGRSEESDYVHTGYDKGHMAPAGDFTRGSRAMYETFLMSNMAPQRPSLNQHIWKKLEDQVRRLARDHGRVWVFTGPLYRNKAGDAIAPDSFIGDNEVAVPTHFFKIVLCEHSGGSLEMFAFIMPNQESTFTNVPVDYLVTVDEVERLSGRRVTDRLNFFDVLPKARQDQLEARRAPSWPVP